MIKAALLQVGLLVLAQCALIYALATEPLVEVKVQPPMVMHGGAVRVTCSVPRNAANRGLDVGLNDYVSSHRDLEGENARVTWEFVFEHVPCVVEKAGCLLTRTDGAVLAATPVKVVGCDDAH